MNDDGPGEEMKYPEPRSIHLINSSKSRPGYRTVVPQIFSDEREVDIDFSRFIHIGSVLPCIYLIAWSACGDP